MGCSEREGKKVGGVFASDEKADGAEGEMGGMLVTMSDLKREWGV